jgi:hypothetical protein
MRQENLIDDGSKINWTKKLENIVRLNGRGHVIKNDLIT